MTALEQIADDFYALAKSSSPISQMWDGKLDHLAEWDDLSPEARAGFQSKFLALAKAAEEVDVEGDPAARALRDVVATSARAAALGYDYGPELDFMNPRVGLLELMFSFITGFPLNTAEDGENYLTKLETMPAMFEQLMDVADAAADAGRVTLASHLRMTAEQVEDYLATPAGPDERLCAQAAPTSFDEAEAAAWKERLQEVVRVHVRPGLAQYRTRMLVLAERGRPDDKPGVVHLEGGLDLYKDQIWANLLLDKSPEELHQLGLDQVARLEEEYRELAGPLVGSDDVQEIYARLRDDPSLRYDSAETLIADATKALARAEEASKEWFGALPKSKCTANPTDFGPMGYYSGPDPETGKQPAFYVKTSDPSAWSTYELEGLTFHEAIPGHHLQIALAAEDENLHKVQREFHNTAYVEGWALYSERLSDEMGLYSTPMARVGMLLNDSMRACRLVVDTGMHALGWTRDQAIQYMVDHSPIDAAHVAQEIDRYIAWPGQALSYMVGRLEIQAIRAEAEKAEDFDIRDFHDRVLRYGSVPLTTLRAQVLED
ncbi:DUF885 domain-containing protein [Demequina zhanjiangensis]|uniref:DUF885 domain-containing protein n=1 Tax=Demequina zhanjiangensis TaxID=3051659 RepID=A0ABT8G2X7_9MICO|nr:DUF885 domain-containing protein [Demequina sp. SYSU T00b26]MDN4473506.1 DUF885 domain-containing protein [Demequina sp. SYSU T00b26]